MRKWTLSLPASESYHDQDKLGKLAPERQTILDFAGARDDGLAVASAGPYANHLHLAPDR